ISFTGSVETGRALAARAVAGMKKIQLEMGGKNPLIVLDDADLDNAVECAVQGAFYSTGQRCTATSRVIVTPGIYGRFRQALLARTTALVVGDALDEKTQIGPAVDAAQLKTDLDYIAVGQKEGARLAVGGERPPPRCVRRREGLELRVAGAGGVRRRVLHAGENRLHQRQHRGLEGPRGASNSGDPSKMCQNRPGGRLVAARSRKGGCGRVPKTVTKRPGGGRWRTPTFSPPRRTPPSTTSPVWPPGSAGRRLP